MEGMQDSALSTNRNPFEEQESLKENRPVNVGWPVGGAIAPLMDCKGRDPFTECY